MKEDSLDNVTLIEDTNIGFKNFDVLELLG